MTLVTVDTDIAFELRAAGKAEEADDVLARYYYGSEGCYLGLDSPHVNLDELRAIIAALKFIEGSMSSTTDTPVRESDVFYENGLLKRFIRNEFILARHQIFHGNVFSRAYKDQGKINGEVMDIVTDDGKIEMWQHLLPEKE